MNNEHELAAACAQWQDNRDGGSSPLRAAARVILNVKHYFAAPFIDKLEAAAKADPRQIDRANVLLAALAETPLKSADEWNAALKLSTRAFAGRGIQEKPREDPQILEQLATGVIRMPLWGVSLNPAVAGQFGVSKEGRPARFIFQIENAFPAIPAWVHSGIKADEEELICGGEYEVVSIEDVNGTSIVRLNYRGQITATSN